MTYKIREGLLSMYSVENAEHELNEVLKDYRRFVLAQSKHSQIKEIRSMLNRIRRFDLWSSSQMFLAPEPGDICYLDYGHAYKNEAGYQHFGLILTSWNQKLLVLPMTSNPTAAKEAGNIHENGRSHLYYIGNQEGLNKASTLFLNDAKFINSSRVISINGHIRTDSFMFEEILQIMFAQIMTSISKGIKVEKLIEIID